MFKERKTKISVKKIAEFLKSDYDGDDFEIGFNSKYIMDIVNKTHKDFRAVILLHLWYESDEINPNNLRDFLSRWENKLFFKIDEACPNIFQNIYKKKTII